MGLSVNKEAVALLERALDEKEKLGIVANKGPLGCLIVDAGIKAPGGYAAGKWVVEVCLGGQGCVALEMIRYGELLLPSVLVETDSPAVAALGSQLAGWSIKTGDYCAMGSGPARALSRKPKEIYEAIQYEDHCDSAVIVLEATSLPTESAIRAIAGDCKISPKNLYVVVMPTSSIVGSIQISGRVVEMGIHRLYQLGLDPKLISFGCGSAPISPVHPSTVQAMARTNDALFYGGVAFYMMTHENVDELRNLVSRSPSCSSNDYGKSFYEILEAAQFDFYKVDPGIFPPSTTFLNNTKTGVTFKAGSINVQMLKKTLGIVNV